MKAMISQQQGFSLPEILLVLVLGMMLTGTVISVALTALKLSEDNREQVQLNHNLRASLDLILSDLKRAGGLSGSDLPQNRTDLQSLYRDNPFMDATSNLKLWNCDANHHCSCVTFSYDLDGDYTPYAGTMNHFGFRLSGSRLQLRTGTSVPAGATHPGCAYSNPDNTWESLTEDEITITRFTISYINRYGDSIALPEATRVTDGSDCHSGDTCIAERHLQVVISGASQRFALTVAGKVRVRNDRYFIQP